VSDWDGKPVIPKIPGPRKPAAERDARQKYDEAAAAAKAAWDRWYRNDTPENWTRYEQASSRAVAVLQALRQLEAPPIT